jgi:hypothetical protein
MATGRKGFIRSLLNKVFKPKAIPVPEQAPMPAIPKRSRFERGPCRTPSRKLVKARRKAQKQARRLNRSK